MKRRLTERFETSEQDPSSMLWGNGTTDKRFDIARNGFVDPTDKQKMSEIDFLHPLFFTHDVTYMFKYVSGHITKDYDIPASSTRKHFKQELASGLIVLAKLKPGVQLFDFTDIEDFKKVFGKDGEAIAPIFQEAEPYFAFNTTVINKYQQYEPIEFSIAKKMAVYLAIDKKWEDGEVIQSFFTGRGHSFIQIFAKKADAELFNKKITREMYREFLAFYKATLVGAEEKKSKTGRDQLVKWNQVRKIYPDSLDDEQLAKLNGYFKLLKFCITCRDTLSDPDYFPQETYQKVLNNTNTKERVGFIDLLQACLYLAIDLAEFSGFWCPEYIGKKTVELDNKYPSIALFDSTAIEKYEVYTFSQIQDVMSYMKEKGQLGTNLLLQNLRDGIASKEEADKEKAAAYKRAADDIQDHKDKGEHYVDDTYLLEVWKALKDDYDLWLLFKKKLEKEYWHQWIKSSPKVAANKARELADKNRKERRDSLTQEIKQIEQQLRPENINKLDRDYIQYLKDRKSVINAKLMSRELRQE